MSPNTVQQCAISYDREIFTKNEARHFFHNSASVSPWFETGGASKLCYAPCLIEKLFTVQVMF